MRILQFFNGERKVSENSLLKIPLFETLLENIKQDTIFIDRDVFLFDDVLLFALHLIIPDDNLSKLELQHYGFALNDSVKSQTEGKCHDLLNEIINGYKLFYVSACGETITATKTKLMQLEYFKVIFEERFQKTKGFEKNEPLDIDIPGPIFKDILAYLGDKKYFLTPKTYRVFKTLAGNLSSNLDCVRNKVWPAYVAPQNAFVEMATYEDKKRYVPKLDYKANHAYPFRMDFLGDKYQILVQHNRVLHILEDVFLELRFKDNQDNPFLRIDNIILEMNGLPIDSFTGFQLYQRRFIDPASLNLPKDIIHIPFNLTRKPNFLPIVLLPFSSIYIMIKLNNTLPSDVDPVLIMYFSTCINVDIEKCQKLEMSLRFSHYPTIISNTYETRNQRRVFDINIHWYNPARIIIFSLHQDDESFECIDDLITYEFYLGSCIRHSGTRNMALILNKMKFNIKHNENDPPIYTIPLNSDVFDVESIGNLDLTKIDYTKLSLEVSERVECVRVWGLYERDILFIHGGAAFIEV